MNWFNADNYEHPGPELEKILAALWFFIARHYQLANPEAMNEMLVQSRNTQLRR